MQPFGLRPEQEAAVSLICSSRQNTPLPDHGRHRPGKALPRRRKMGSRVRGGCNDPDHSLRDELPTACRGEGIGLLRVRSAERVTPLRRPGPIRRTQAVVGLLGCYARSETMRSWLSSPEESTGPSAESGADRLADHGPGIRSLAPSSGFPIFARSVAKRLFARVRCVPPEDRGCC